jgi:hypothetical protein
VKFTGRIHCDIKIRLRRDAILDATRLDDGFWEMVHRLAPMTE